MGFYKKKPVVIEAQAFAGYSSTPMKGPVFESKMVQFTDYDANNTECQKCGHLFDEHGSVPTLEGSHIACPGDYIIRGIQGEFYPCKPDIFKATYDEVITNE